MIVRTDSKHEAKRRKGGTTNKVKGVDRVILSWNTNNGRKYNSPFIHYTKKIMQVCSSTALILMRYTDFIMRTAFTVFGQVNWESNYPRNKLKVT